MRGTRAKALRRLYKKNKKYIEQELFPQYDPKKIRFKNGIRVDAFRKLKKMWRLKLQMGDVR